MSSSSSKWPLHKIHFGHRVLNVTEKDDNFTIYLSSNNTFDGDVVVGADVFCLRWEQENTSEKDSVYSLLVPEQLL